MTPVMTPVMTPDDAVMRLPEQLAAGTPELMRVNHLLRAGAMRPYLLRALASRDSDLSCHVLDAKYVPGERCTVLYAVGGQLVTGQRMLAGDDAGLRLWVFPDDPALPGLGLLTSPTDLCEALRDVLPEGRRLRGCRAGLVRYRLHRRAVFMITARVGDRPVRYVAKAYHDERKAAAVYAETRRLADVLAGDGGLVLAEPLAFVPGPALVVQREVGGQPLDQFFGDRRGAHRGGREGVRRAGAALAALHHAPRVSTRERPVLAELSRFARRAAAVSEVRPELGAQLQAVTQALADRGRELPPASSGLVHGDCKPSQFLLRRAGVALLDFDHCGVADPASDVGTFLATLRQRGLSGGAAAGAGCLGAQFLAAYQEAAGDGVPGRAGWYEAVALVRKALRGFARAPGSPLPAALAAEATRCLSGVEGRAA